MCVRRLFDLQICSGFVSASWRYTQKHGKRFSLRRYVLNIPDPEHAAGGETEVEITDLDSGKVPGRYTRDNRLPWFPTRAWMSIAMIGGIALLVVVVLVSVSHLPKVAKVTSPVPINDPVSLSVVDGICYATATNGVVTALRVSDGSLLWRHVGGKTGEESATVADGVVYLVPLLPPDSTATTVTVEALRASDGSPLWSRTLPRDSPAFIQLTVVNSIVYVRSEADTIDALRASDGSLLWSYTSRTPTASTVADGVVYLSTQDSHLSALRASDGSPIWQVALHATDLLPLMDVTGGVVYVRAFDGSVDALRESSGSILWRHQGGEEGPASITVAQGVIYLAFYTMGFNNIGSITVLRASDGFVLWRYTSHVPARQLSPVETDGLVLIASQDGSIDALRASSGTLLWHRAMNS
jgi:outer membrane protein assembly factor BamB